MSEVFKRIYIDIPADTHLALKLEAVQRGVSQKALVADLIAQACATKPAKKTAKKRGKKRG